MKHNVKCVLPFQVTHDTSDVIHNPSQFIEKKSTSPASKVHWPYSNYGAVYVVVLYIKWLLCGFS